MDLWLRIEEWFGLEDLDFLVIVIGIDAWPWVEGFNFLEDGLKGVLIPEDQAIQFFNFVGIGGVGMVLRFFVD